MLITQVFLRAIPKKEKAKAAKKGGGKRKE